MLVVDQFSPAVISCKPRNFASTMVADSARQIIGHANVEHAIMLIRDDVDPEVIVPHHRK